MTCKSKFTKDDPDYNEPPPTREDFISATPSRKSSVTGLIAEATGFITTALSPRQAKAAAKTKLQTAPTKKTPIGPGAIPKGAASQSAKKTAPPSLSSSSKGQQRTGMPPPPPPAFSITKSGNTTGLTQTAKETSADKKHPPTEVKKLKAFDCRIKTANEEKKLLSESETVQTPSPTEVEE